MAPTNDATIDIPLEPVTSNGGGLRSQSSTTALQAERTNTSSEKNRGLWKPRGRRPKPENRFRPKGKVGYDGEEDTINVMGHIYKKIRDFSVVTRYFLYVLPLAAIIAIPIIIDANNPSNATVGGEPYGGVRILWFFVRLPFAITNNACADRHFKVWVEVIWLSLWVSKCVAHYLPFIFRILAGTVSSGVRKYSSVIGALEIPLSLLGWAVTSLATFIPIMRKNPDTVASCKKFKPTTTQTSCYPNWENVVQQILAATTIAAGIYLIEKTIIQLISINYHRKQFNARIKDSKRNIYVLGLLYDASRYLFPMYCQEFAEEDYTIADQLNLSRGSKTPGQHTRSGSATPMRIIQNVGAGFDKVTSAFGNVAKEVTGKQVFNPNSAHSIVVEALEKNRTAEALAKRIWMSFVVEGRDALLQEDIIDVLGPEAKTEAEEAFWVLDRDMNGDVSLDEMILTVTEFGRERKSIASSMHDVDQAINVLDRLLAVVVFIIAVLVFVAFLNASFVSTLATAGTALLSLSFVFSVSAQEVLGSCIFLFVKHPYDIGDRVDIGTLGCLNQEHFVVEHISLLFTVFRHVQGLGVGRICQIPNIVLNTLWVENVSRSKAMTEQLSMDIAFDTSFDDINILKNELLTFVTTPENSRDYQPTVDVEVLGTSDQSKLTLLVDVKHKSNWANETVRRSRRGKFMCALVSALKAVPIYPPGGGSDAAGSAANPTYSVAITQPEAKEHAEETAKGREEARLVPTKKIEDSKERLSPMTSSAPLGAGLTEAESRVVDDLTSRDPASDPARDEAWTSAREDSSTLGERPSIDRSDLDEVRGMLRRESTRGKRKPSNDYHPSVPTIQEPESQPYTYSVFPQTSSASGYENQRPSNYPVARPPVSQYQAPPQVPYPAPTSPLEMSQVPQRSPSNPYRQRNEALSPPREEEDDDFNNMRPYSGV